MNSGQAARESHVWRTVCETDMFAAPIKTTGKQSVREGRKIYVVKCVLFLDLGV